MKPYLDNILAHLDKTKRLMVHNILIIWVHNYMKPIKQYQKDMKIKNSWEKICALLLKKGKKLCLPYLFISNKKIFFPLLT